MAELQKRQRSVRLVRRLGTRLRRETSRNCLLRAKLSCLRRLSERTGRAIVGARSWGDIDDDLGVVRDVTSQPPVRRSDEFSVDFQTSGQAA